MLRIITICGALWLITSECSTQVRFVQFIVPELENDEQCRWVEEYVRQNAGIESVRAERVSDNFLAFIEPGFDYSEVEFTAWLAEIGYSITCFRTGITGTDRILRLKPEDCSEPKIPDED